jgi:hypothetical protein
MIMMMDDARGSGSAYIVWWDELQPWMKATLNSGQEAL